MTPAGVCWRDETRDSRGTLAGRTVEMLSKAMLQWNRTTKSICALAGIATYVALAEWSKASFVDYTPTGKTVVRIFRPFEKFGASSYAVIAHEWTTQGSLEDIADSADDNQRSPVLIYENGRQLGPAHSKHADIASLGMGRYSHWRGLSYVISATDNSDPNTNGRFYWAVVPY